MILFVCALTIFLLAIPKAAHDEHKRKMRRASFQPSAASLYQLFRKIAPTFFEVLFTFFVTLSLFPAISASVDSVGWEGSPCGRAQLCACSHTFFTTQSETQQYHSKYGKHYYTAVFCFLLFNASDLLGRMLAGWKQWVGVVRTGHCFGWTVWLALPSPRKLIRPPLQPASHQLRLLKYPVLIRGVFILLFPMLNVQLGTAENPGSYWLPRILDKDVFAYLLMLLMGASNGWSGCAEEEEEWEGRYRPLTTIHPS